MLVVNILLFATLFANIISDFIVVVMDNLNANKNN